MWKFCGETQAIFQYSFRDRQKEKEKRDRERERERERVKFSLHSKKISIRVWWMNNGACDQISFNSMEDIKPVVLFGIPTALLQKGFWNSKSLSFIRWK